MPYLRPFTCVHLVLGIEPSREVALNVLQEEGIEPLEEGVVEAKVKLGGFPDRLLEFPNHVSPRSDLKRIRVVLLDILLSKSSAFKLCCLWRFGALFSLAQSLHWYQPWLQI